jgi:hypothetical protein
VKVSLDAAGKPVQVQPGNPRPAGNNNNNNNKRKGEQPTPRYDNWQVAVVEEEQPAEQGSSRRPRTGKVAWQPKLTFEQMVDAPCKHHSGVKPSTHTLRNCSITQLLMRGDLPPLLPGPSPELPPPPPPLPAAGALANNAFPRPDTAYIVFTSEGDDKHSKRKYQHEVNATVPPVPQYMHWSDRPVSWTREDHPAIMPTPGGYALVLDPTFISERRTCHFPRC